MNNDKKYNVSEIFYSIQGEGTRAGLPCIFVRMQGCNLKCKWCDTEYAQDRHGGEMLSFDDIVDKVLSYDCRFIEFTGGEPLLQNNITDLTDHFDKRKYSVAVETNGSIDLSLLNENIIKIVDIKCPSSGMDEHFLPENLKHISANDEIKFVIANRNDYEWAKSFFLENIGENSKAAVLFSPAYSLIEPQELAKWILNDKLNVRLQLQMHKYIWHPAQRGV